MLESAPVTTAMVNPERRVMVLWRKISAGYFGTCWLAWAMFLLVAGVSIVLLPLLGLGMVVIAQATGTQWCINPYVVKYIDYLLVAAVLAALLGWLAAVVVWLRRRLWLRAACHIVMIPLCVLGLLPILFVSGFMLTPLLPPLAYDWVYSVRMGRYYILASEPALTDTGYQILSAPKLWWPLWRREFTDKLEYSEDGSLTSDPQLILSRNQALLVVARGGQKTDALDLESGSALTRGIPWSEADREAQWAARTRRIDALLAQASGSPAAPRAAPARCYTRDELTRALTAATRPLCDEYCERLLEAMNDPDATVECRLRELEESGTVERSGRGTLTAKFMVRYTTGGVSGMDLRDVELFVSDGSVKVLAADSGLLWSGPRGSATERMTRQVAETSRDIFTAFTGRMLELSAAE